MNFESYQDAVYTLAKAFEDYNNERIHSTLEYMTPAEFATKWEMPKTITFCGIHSNSSYFYIA